MPLVSAYVARNPRIKHSSVTSAWTAEALRSYNVKELIKVLWREQSRSDKMVLDDPMFHIPPCLPTNIRTIHSGNGNALHTQLGSLFNKLYYEQCTFVMLSALLCTGGYIIELPQLVEPSLEHCLLGMSDLDELYHVESVNSYGFNQRPITLSPHALCIG